jgi:hypothetical protein
MSSMLAARACRRFKMQAPLEATLKATMLRMEPVEETQLRLKRVGAAMPIYARQWRELSGEAIMQFCIDVVSSVQLRDALPADKRQDCAIVNVLIDTWRERGLELTTDGSRAARYIHCSPASFPIREVSRKRIVGYTRKSYGVIQELFHWRTPNIPTSRCT